MKGRELATVLAALRVYQQQLEMNGGAPPQDVEDVATNVFEFEPMSVGEIDQLCERLNMQSAQRPALGSRRPERPSAGPARSAGPVPSAGPLRYLYRPLLRPAGFATMPAGLRWDYVEVPREIAHLRPNLPVSRHRYGVIVCECELTKTECRHFDLERVPEERTAGTGGEREEPTVDEGVDEDLGESR